MHTGRRDNTALLGAAGLMAVLSQPRRIPDGAGAGGTTLPAGAARGRTDVPYGRAWHARVHFAYPGRIRCSVVALGAGDYPHRPGGGAGLVAPSWRVSWGAVPWLCGAHAMVPGLSGKGRAAESGGAGPGPGARPSL